MKLLVTKASVEKCFHFQNVIIMTIFWSFQASNHFKRTRQLYRDNHDNLSKRNYPRQTVTWLVEQQNRTDKIAQKH